MKVPGIPYHQGRNDYDDRDGRKYGMAIHNTSNDASDSGEASYADHRTDGVSSHFYVDGDSVTQSIDTDDRVGHAGSYEGNEHAIAFEITGTNAKSRTWWLANVAWSKLGYVIAYMIRNDPDLAGFQVRRASVAEMKANPKIKAFYSHNDMRLAWGGTSHTDPGPNFPWDRLFQAVNDALGGREEDDMQLTDTVKLMQGPDVDYSEATTTVAGILASTNYYLLSTRNKLLAAEADQKLRDAAILAKLAGGDSATIVGAVKAEGELIRAELAARAAEDAARDAALADLVQRIESGGATAQEVLGELRNLLPAA